MNRQFPTLYLPDIVAGVISVLLGCAVYYFTKYHLLGSWMQNFGDPPAHNPAYKALAPYFFAAPYGAGAIVVGLVARNGRLGFRPVLVRFLCGPLGSHLRPGGEPRCKICGLYTPCYCCLRGIDLAFGDIRLSINRGDIDCCQAELFKNRRFVILSATNLQLGPRIRLLNAPAPPSSIEQEVTPVLLYFMQTNGWRG